MPFDSQVDFWHDAPTMLKSKNPAILNRHQVAELSYRLKDELLKEWQIKAREEVDAAQNQSVLALRDSMPSFIDQLISTLQSENPNGLIRKNAQVASEHGEDRARQPDYTLPEIIFEYHILRAIIIEKLEAHGPIDSLARKIIHEFIDRGISSAVGRYYEIESYKENLQKAEIEASRDKAEISNQAKTAFLANMSHEIRTPLGAIMGFVDLLRQEGTSKPDRSTYLAIIDRNSQHLLRIVDDILDLSKVEAGKMLIEKIRFSLVDFLADLSSLAAMKARENGNLFEFKSGTLLPEFVVTDSTRLRQILSNVVGNAIKFTDKGHVELLVTYEAPELRFRVTDTGRGISADQRPLLFQAFAQADASTTRRFGGTGLGLVLTKKLSQALGGDFSLIWSEVGVGSTFEVRLPITIPAEVKLIPVQHGTLAHTRSEGAQNLTDLHGLKILLVEDSPDNQCLIQAMLTKAGSTVALASDGAQGVEKASHQPYDVILMDIQMPIMDGHQAVKKLRALGFRNPIVALTAHAMKEERERAVQSGFSHFLTKPIHRKSLLDLLGQLRGMNNTGNP